MPLHKAWNQVAKVWPDSRAQQSHNEKKHKLLGWMEECFCANCGCSQGMISKEWAQYVFSLCDDCIKEFGPPPGTIQVPEELLRKKENPCRSIMT